jgi:translation initiation factor 4E
MPAEVSRADDGGLLAEKDMEEDTLSSSSVVAGVTASTASGSGHDAGEVAALGDASEAPEAASASAPRRLGQKHHLQHTWCLWALLHDKSSKDDWQNSQMNVHAFSTIEDFWRLISNIKTPSRLGSSDFSIFKKDIAPAWEDDTCRQGGRWIAKIDKQLPPQDFDELWLNLCLSIIGENFGEPGHCVCGAVVSTRSKSSKMALWISEREEDKAIPIGRAFKKILQDAGVGGDISFEDFTNQSKATLTLSRE